MVFENFPLGEINDPEDDGGHLKIDEVEVFEQINYDFSVTIIPSDKISIRFGYNAGKYDENIVKQIGEQFFSIITGFDKLVTSGISEVDILLDAEKHRLLNEFNGTVEPVPAMQTVVDIFEAQVDKTPDSTAVVFGNQQLTYRELNEKANCLAHYLKKTYDLKGDDFVGIMVDRSCSLLISILGVMKAGAAYVPVDKDYPSSRKSFMIGDAAPKVLIIESDSLLDVIDYNVKIFSIDLEFQQLPVDEAACRNPVKCTAADNLAYVIYTSGSTGRPKGVMVEHGNLVNSIMPQLEKFSVSAADHFLQFSSSSFDSSVWEIFIGLLSGGTLYMIEEKQKYDVAHFVKFAADYAISFATLPPAFFNVLPVEELGSIKTLITAGEQAVIEQSRKFAQNAKFVNGYGPTECCICATVFDEVFGATVPIGRPIANTQVYILDKQGKLVPQGAAGEICLGGNGVARGYLNNEVLTREKFVENPFIPGKRMYRTGDLARWLPDGNIEFMGRVDEQVKIRGFRVELGEITAMLAGHESIKEAVVIAKEQPGGDKMLVAYYVPHTATDSVSIRKYLSEKLPDYMVPSYYVSLDILPLTINGKLDKDALDDLDIDNPEDYTAPSGETEEKLQLIWSDVLKLDKERISADKSFFELGGHSLRASLLGGRIIKEFNINMPLDLVFSLQTIQKIAEYLDNEQWLKDSVELQPSLSNEIIYID
jgi:amino acid adenylation domain-containing protein